MTWRRFLLCLLAVVVSLPCLGVDEVTVMIDADSIRRRIGRFLSSMQYPAVATSVILVIAIVMFLSGRATKCESPPTAGAVLILFSALWVLCRGMVIGVLNDWIWHAELPITELFFFSWGFTIFGLGLLVGSLRNTKRSSGTGRVDVTLTDKS